MWQDISGLDSLHLLSRRCESTRLLQFHGPCSSLSRSFKHQLALHNLHSTPILFVTSCVMAQIVKVQNLPTIRHRPTCSSATVTNPDQTELDHQNRWYVDASNNNATLQRACRMHLACMSHLLFHVFTSKYHHFHFMMISFNTNWIRRACATQLSCEDSATQQMIAQGWELHT